MKASVNGADRIWDLKLILIGGTVEKIMIPEKQKDDLLVEIIVGRCNVFKIDGMTREFGKGSSVLREKEIVIFRKDLSGVSATEFFDNVFDATETVEEIIEELESEPTTLEV